MLADRFTFLNQYCVGDGIEFGEDASNISNAKQFRCAPFTINGERASTAHPHNTHIENDSVDFVLCLHYLEHFKNTEEILSHWWEKISEGGSLIVALPEAGIYPRIGECGCNPDHKVNFNLESFPELLNAIDASFVIVASEIVDEVFYLVVRKDSNASAIWSIDTPKFSVVIPVYGNNRITKECVDSIFENDNPDEVIIVDDCSPTKYYDKRVKFIRSKRNYGFPRSVNTGVEACRNDFVVVVNNDIIVKPNGLSKLVHALKDPMVAMVGQDGGKLSDSLIHIGKAWKDPDYIEMFCCAFRKAVWNIVGRLDEGMGRGYGEDSDWGIRARRLGYRLVTVRNCCEHKEGQTFGRGQDVLDLIEINRKRLFDRYYRGSVLWVMASLGCNGGSKVVQKMAAAMQDDGWNVSVCSLVPWETAANGWERFTHEKGDTIKPQYDVVISTFHSTMPFAYKVHCKYRFALIQSDEPEWFAPDRNAHQSALNNFTLPDFKAIVIADYMWEFSNKYGMDIVGQIDNGVDNLVFTPDWTFKREWPHKIMLVRKSAPVWYAGQEYAEQAVSKLAAKYNDFSVLVLGGNRPQWSCNVDYRQSYNERQISNFYNSVSAMVIPSLIEGSSLVPLEAMASGCPVVTTRVGVDYGVNEENVMFIPYTDSDAIVDAVSKIFDDEELRNKLYLNGLATAHQRTWENEQKQFMDIIKSVVKF